MNLKYRVSMLCLVMFLSFGMEQKVFSDGSFSEIDMADRKVILGQYEDAKVIYQKVIETSEQAVVEAYAHYKLGALYKKQSKLSQAKAEYEKGILSLKQAGQSQHKIGKYLTQALASAD